MYAKDMTDVNLTEFKEQNGENALRLVIGRISATGIMNLIKKNIPSDRIPSRIYRLKDKQMLTSFLVNNV